MKIHNLHQWNIGRASEKSYGGPVFVYRQSRSETQGAETMHIAQIGTDHRGQPTAYTLLCAWLSQLAEAETPSDHNDAADRIKWLRTNPLFHAHAHQKGEKTMAEQVKETKKTCNHIGILIGFFLLVVASFIFWIAQFTHGSFGGYILVGIVGTIIFIIGFYPITKKRVKC